MVLKELILVAKTVSDGEEFQSFITLVIKLYMYFLNVFLYDIFVALIHWIL